MQCPNPEEMIQHAVSDYDQSTNNAVSLRKEKQNASCGGKSYRGEMHCIQEMTKGLPYAVWGGEGLIVTASLKTFPT